VTSEIVMSKADDRVRPLEGGDQPVALARPRRKPMSARTDLIETYHEGFRTRDHEGILATLTDDVAWDLPGHRHLQGKADFREEIDNPDFQGQPTLTIDRFIEGADEVCAIGTGIAETSGGDDFHFAYIDVFTFRGDLVCRVESYVVPLADGWSPGS
jgi:ketosteroid isomerase-like protein